MAAFENMQHFSENFMEFVGLFRKRPLDDDIRDNLDLIDGLHVGSPPAQPQMPPTYPSNEEKWTHYPYILNVAIRSNEKDDVISQMCSEFCQANIEHLKEYEVRRVGSINSLKVYCIIRMLICFIQNTGDFHSLEIKRISKIFHIPS